MNRRIIHPGKLLSTTGNLNELGYATYLIKDYNREDIKTSKLRIKEWDYYYFGDNEMGIAMTLADNGYMGLCSFSILDFSNKTYLNKANMFWFPLGKTNMPLSSKDGSVSKVGKNYKVDFINDNGRRHLHLEMDNVNNKKFICDVRLALTSPNSLVIATPFKKKKHFYYNQKINNLEADGYFEFGETKHTFKKGEAYGVLDWGRGVWEYKNAWYWSSLSGRNSNGDLIGFNLGYGFGDTTASSENMVFMNQKCYKLNDVKFIIPKDEKGKNLYLNEWDIISDDKKVNLHFTPILDRHDKSSALIISQDAHQVFGRFIGTIDVGETTIQIDNMLGFAEYVKNKW